MSTTRRQFVHVLGLTGASAALAGCDSASDALAALLAPRDGAEFTPPSTDQIDDAAHVLNRLTYGPTPGDYQRVRTLGAQAFISEQLDPDSISDRQCQWRVAPIESLTEPTPELYNYHPKVLLADLTRARMLRGVYSKRQLFELMVEFWTDHFNILSSKGDCKWLKAADDRDVIRAHALGRFRDLVRASAVSPAMLIYLDGHDNKVRHDGERPNENYARELLELHTLGVHGGYTQADVSEVARCLSGWTYGHQPFKFRQAHVGFDPDRHDNGVKFVLGQAIPAGGGADDLERVLDILCNHPATAAHIAGRLCRAFISDPAPDDAVGQAADAFTRSGGDIRHTLGALVATSGFWSSRGTLFKRPQRFIISALRATGAMTDCGLPVMNALGRMGHAPYQYPTPDGYPIEQQPWLGTLLWRWNFALDLQRGRIDGTRIDAPALTESLGGRENLAAHLLGRLPTDLESQVLEHSAAPLAMLLGSPAFQWH